MPGEGGPCLGTVIELSAQAHKREKRARSGLGQSARHYSASGTAR